MAEADEVSQNAPERGPERGPERDARTGRAAAAERIRHQTQWVDLQLRQAQERGAFDNLPGFGKPLNLSQDHDPDWWLKQLIAREQVTGVLPPALALRKEDAELDDALDTLATEREVRDRLEEFNERVRKALYSQYDGPPLITQQRDVEAGVAAWRARRADRLAQRRAPQEGAAADFAAVDRPPKRRWWRRWRRRRDGG